MQTNLQARIIMVDKEEFGNSNLLSWKVNIIIKEKTSSTEHYLEVMNRTTQEPTMGRIVEVTNIYNPYQYTNPCYNLKTQQIFIWQVKKGVFLW